MEINENLIQFIKYALAGGFATLVHIGIFHLVGWKMLPCLQEGDHLVRLLNLKLKELPESSRAKNSMIANAIAFVISNLAAYITNIIWVFEPGRHQIIIEIMLFYAVSGISVLIGTALMGFIIKRFGLLTTYAFGANIFTAVMFNYALRKFFIFQG
ncbi:MAG: hypothetical protein CSB24_04075 [Deltaproteobacteria bacterium]|nr:MAG: hypothetical protein CSB24_04075 [Deltaproteobacteria bacterium]